MSTKQHSFPSHVSVQSFVTVKLSDKHMYGLWETQMLCLLESHDLLGYINQSSPVAADDDEWSRWDTLVHAWILGSLSEHTAVDVLNRLNSRQTYLTAKDVWNEVRSMYGQQATADRVQEWKVGTNGMLLKEKVKEERERSRIKQDLYHAVECGKLEDVKSILNKGVIGITDSISINGNTALHIAASNSNGILESLLNLRPTDIPLKDVRNEDGSTLLHLAVSHGNMNAAKILVNWSRDLLYAKDNHGFTPLDIVLSQPLNKEMCHFLIDQDAQIPIVAHEPLLNVISYGHFDLALTFIKRCNSFKSRAVLMAIAQNCPADFTPNQLLVYELFQTPVRQFITRGASDMKSCMKFANFVIRAVLAYPYKLLIQICMKLRVFKDLEEKMQQRKNARDLLDVACALIKFSREGEGEGEADAGDFYTEAMLEAIRRDASDVVEIIVYWFPEAVLMVDVDGHNIAQVAWKNRASKVYALILDGNLAKHTSVASQKMRTDHCGNNFLHFAARLGPAKKLDHTSSPPFRMQRELLWFKLAHEITPQGYMEKNCFGETPDMVFTKEHKDLEIESGEWIKTAANAVAITATLIITVMFASTIQVPGGTNDKGAPNLISQPAFMLFEISITTSAMASALALMLFLVILTSPRTQDDYLLRLPIAMVIGIISLFTSAALGTLAFGAALYLIFGFTHPWISSIISSIVVLPIFICVIVYYWYLSTVIGDFMNSTFHFFIIHGFRRLQLVGRIFI